MKRGIVFAFAFLFLFMIIFAEAATKKEAETAINNAKEIMQEMQRAGFNIIRINDSIIEMKQSYDAQVALEEKTGKADYSSIVTVYERVKDIKEKAFLAYDEITI